MVELVEFKHELMALCRHPERGQFLCAHQHAAAGSTIAVCSMSDVVKAYFDTVDDFAASVEAHVDDAADFLMHCCPAGDGRICEQDTAHWNAFLNHSSSPNLTQVGERFAASHLLLVAARDISVGDELTVDYDKAVGNEKHGHEEHIRAFLEVADKHNVEKRPSKLTAAAIKVSPAILASPIGPTIDGMITFIYSEDVAAARVFYGEQLGLQLRKDLGSVVFYALPGTGGSLGIVKQGVSAAEVPPCSARQAGRDTVMLCLLSDDVSGWHARLLQHGRSFEQPPKRTEKFGIFNALLRDPDGYLVEIQPFLDTGDQASFCRKRKAGDSLVTG